MGKTKKVFTEDNTDELEGENDSPIQLTPEQEKQKENEVAKFLPGRKKVEEVQKYRELKIVDVNDDEGYETVRVALKDCRDYRGQLKKDKRAIKRPFEIILEDIDAAATYVETELLSVETIMKQQKEPIDAERDRIIADKKAKKAAQFIIRNQELTKLGATFDGKNFVLNDVIYSMTDIEGVDDDIYTSVILPQYKDQWQKAEDIRLAAQKVIDDAAAEIAQKQQQIALQEKQLKDRQDEFNRQENERNARLAKEKQEKNTARSKELETLGMKYSRVTNSYSYDDLVISVSDQIDLLPDDAWASLIEGATAVVAAKKKLAEIEEKKKNAIAAEGKIRKGMLSFFKYVTTSKHSEEELGKLEEEAWTALHSDYRSENTKKEHEEWLKNEAEQKRLKSIEDQKKLDESTDNVKWKTVLDHLKQTPIVEMKSKKYQDKWHVVRDFLSDMGAI